MTDLVIREQLQRWVVEEDMGGGLFRKVSLWEYVERTNAEAVAAFAARLRAGVEGLATYPDFAGYPGIDRAEVLSLIDQETGGGR